jgi:hypothetical protein
MHCHYTRYILSTYVQYMCSLNKTGTGIQISQELTSLGSRIGLTRCIDNGWALTSSADPTTSPSTNSSSPATCVTKSVLISFYIFQSSLLARCFLLLLYSHFLLSGPIQEKVAGSG